MHTFSLLLLSLTWFHHVTAWSGLGHCTVGYVAQALFTDAAANLVNDLLQNNDQFKICEADADNCDICDAATWADRVRRTHEYAFTAGWHFIDAQDDPPNHCAITYPHDCAGGETPGCVISAITAMTAQMSDPDTSKREEALLFLIHFIGDAHQPLHTEKLSRGGNDIDICFFDKCGSDSRPMELHAIWDAEIPDKHRGVADSSKWPVMKEAGKAWADDLAASQVPQILAMTDDCLDINTAQKCALKWAGEANAHVCDYVLKDFPFQMTSLGDDYFNGAVPIVDELIAKAGVRLGNWINALAEATSGGIVIQNGDGEL